MCSRADRYFDRETHIVPRGAEIPKIFRSEGKRGKRGSSLVSAMIAAPRGTRWASEIGRRLALDSLHENSESEGPCLDGTAAGLARMVMCCAACKRMWLSREAGW